MTFIEWLSDEIHRRGWTQAELADRSGVTRGAISHLFSGTRNPGVEIITKMARALEIPTAEVFRAAGLLETDPEQPPRLGEWVRMFMEADDATRDLMLENARFFSERGARKKRA